MTLSDLKIDIADVRFCNLKSRYERDFVQLGFHNSAIFSHIGSHPEGFAQVSINGQQFTLETMNLLDFQFFSNIPELDKSDTTDAASKLAEIIYYWFPFEAFRQVVPFTIGFLKEVIIRGRLLALNVVSDISERNEPELISRADGPLMWNTLLIQSCILSQEAKEGLFGYRFVFAFVHPTYGFIDFDGTIANTLSEQWALRSVSLED